MKHDHFIVQSPATPAQQLLLLFHGVGDNPVYGANRQLVRAAVSRCADRQHRRGGTLRSQRSAVVFGAGVTEENRQQRIDAIMPTFIEIVRYWQEKSGVSPLATALIGFSQGRLCRWRVSKRRRIWLRG
jgi:phospholipase/carboxylesterase